ncbi:hypothetical protein [Spirillospora sp. NBC_01491]|uniref:hypothetical protein n=1 Tax=Spirillospora sp. NBC_01491 TaxID=2976007 RepID=UPI002E36D7C7|nr:hypothetical protein [Spirillospora sp. NBC_01491]
MSSAPAARIAESRIPLDQTGVPIVTRPISICPIHPEHALEDGPIRYRCPLGHSVPAADISREVCP